MHESPAVHPHLSVEFTGEQCVVTLNSPERRNAQTPSMWAALEEVCREVERSGTRVVLVRAAGPSFSAGLDRAMLAPGGAPGEADLVGACAESPSSGIAEIEACQRGFAGLRAVPAVVVAAVQGHAVGAGAELAVSADLCIVADDLALSWPEVPLGLVADLGGIGRVTRIVGQVRAMEIMLTGRVIGADEAVSLGLANRAVPRDALDAAAREAVEGLLRLPKDAMREVIGLVRGAGARDDATQQRLEAEAQARLLHAVGRR